MVTQKHQLNDSFTQLLLLSGNFRPLFIHIMDNQLSLSLITFCNKTVLFFGNSENHFISAHLFGISEIILELITQILPDHIVF